MNETNYPLNMPHAIYRLNSVKLCSGLSRATLYLRIKQGLWTSPVRLGGRAVGWPAREVEMLNASFIAGRSNSEIMTLVTKLQADREMADKQ